MTDEQIKARARGYSDYSRDQDTFFRAAKWGITERDAEILDRLKIISNNYEVIKGVYVIKKLILDLFIEDIEQFGQQPKTEQS